MEGLNKSIVEDNIKYKIFIKKGNENIINEIQEYVKVLLNGVKFFNKLDYIWHKGAFNLKEDKFNDEFYLLRGNSIFGDNILDEWLITWCLFKISKKFEQVIITLFDNEGQFLLIEAAQYLDEWMEPEVMDNRVYLKKGKIHIVDVDQRKMISLKQGLESVKETNYLANEEIQKCIQDRIRNYPELAIEQQHLALAWLPKSVAKLLSLDPQLISKAVEAYYLRDPIIFKKCEKMEHFPIVDKVEYKLPMTRTLFSQTLFQKMPNSLLSPFSEWQKQIKHDNDKMAFELGFKVTCGFEMLCYKRDFKVENDSQWHYFFNELVITNYFQGEEENSTKYNQLLNDAKNNYLLMKDKSNENINIKELVNHNPTILQLNEPASNLDWLNFSNNQLDVLLNKFQNSMDLNAEDLMDLEEETKYNKEILQNVNQFLYTETSFKGAERIDDLKQDHESEDEIELDPKAFFDSFKEILDGDNETNNIDEYIKDELKDSNVLEEDMDLDFNMVNQFLQAYQNDPNGNPTLGLL